MTDDSNEVGQLMPFIDDDDVEPAAVAPTDMEIDSTTTQPLNINSANNTTTTAEGIPLMMEPAKVSMIAWSADDKWCFVASNQGEIRVYYAYNGEMACVLKGHEGEVYALDNHPLYSNTILSAGYDGNVILWDVEKQKVITCRNHVGRTFTDCKFSKDAMKYAITDEEGHCTLFGIGGLDKDYEQVRSWERGQYFISDYQALRHFADGSFVDEPTQQPPYLLQPSPIIDLQGVAYPNQKKFGYGRNIPTQSETFELEDMKRSACYDLEEQELLKTDLIVLATIDRATVAKKRREFVKFDDDDEADVAAAAIQLQFPPPPPMLPLLPDDSEDEDYHDDGPGNAGYASSGASSDEGGSDDFITRDDDNSGNMIDDDEGGGGQEEEGRVTRSRAGQLGTTTAFLPPRRNVSSSHMRRSGTGGTSHTRRGRGRGRGRGGSTGGGVRGRPPGSTSRGTRKRNRERSDDEEDQPVRARARRRVAERPSYVESDLESEEEEEEDEEEIDVDNEDEQDGYEAGPSNSAATNYMNMGESSTASSSMGRRSTATAATASTAMDVQEDRKGKRKLRSAGPATTTTNDGISDDEYAIPQDLPHFNHIPSIGSSSSAAATAPTSGRATRSTRAHHQNEPATQPSIPPIHIKLIHKKAAKVRDGPRELTEEEIREHEPIPWITNTEKSLTKYLPQMGDYVAILTEGHKQYLKSSDMKHFFDEKHGVIDKHEPVLFAKIVGINWQVGPPAYCKLKLSMLDLVNTTQIITLGEQVDPIWAPLKRDEIIEYSDEDGSPEFIVLWQRFLTSMDIFRSLQINQKVDAMYDEGPYTGTVSSVNQKGLAWKRANLPSPWAFYHVIWDDVNSPAEDMCPWELVPHGQMDFRTKYGNVEPSLSHAEKKRAKDILDWLSTSSEDFLLYLHQVNFYDYPPYLSLIAYPICLDMIQERLANNFYRSIDVCAEKVYCLQQAG